jgi:putative membrane protein
MQGLLIRWVLNAFALWLVDQLVGGIHIDGAAPLFFAALVLGVLNAILRPLLLLVTLPINLLTLGLFTLVINGAMLRLAAAAVRGFTIAGFGSAVLGAVLLSIISFCLNVFVADSGRIQYIYIDRTDRRRL